MVEGLMNQVLDITRVRRQFPALSREVNGKPAVFFDGPAGSQVPGTVIEAIREYLACSNANHGGLFATSVESDMLLDGAHRSVADLVGSPDPNLVCFGANMTTLTFAFSRALSRTWKPGDEVIVSQSDHDANVTPWVLAASDAGVVVRVIPLRSVDCTLDLEAFERMLSNRTRLVAVGCASNATGTIHDVGRIIQYTHRVGGQVFLDAVHYAPHALMDVVAWGCDYLACSAYKFFGPHVGVLWGKRELLDSLTPYKVRPAPNEVPGKWMTGTQNHEGIAGTHAAVEYLADLGRTAGGDLNRRQALVAGFQVIREYESTLAAWLMAGLRNLKSVRVWGITDLARFHDRVPTFSITHAKRQPEEIARHLAKKGIFVWHGNFYALPVTESLGLEPEGMVRIGLMHYNTVGEIDRLIEALDELE
ncbi:MAG: cysteine desulfurase-like protein [Planctomycetota bacterium]